MRLAKPFKTVATAAHVAASANDGDFGDKSGQLRLRECFSKILATADSLGPLQLMSGLRYYIGAGCDQTRLEGVKNSLTESYPSKGPC